MLTGVMRIFFDISFDEFKPPIAQKFVAKGVKNIALNFIFLFVLCPCLRFVTCLSTKI
jgi:hypothetical protein